MSDGTILQVTKCTGIPRQMLFAKDLSEFVLKAFKNIDTEKSTFSHRFTSKFHRLTILKSQMRKFCK